MRLTPTQSQVAKSRARYRVLCCGRRWGKTTLAIQEMLAKAVSANDKRICYIATTFQQARDIAWTELKRIADPVIDVSNESRLEIVVKTQEGGTSLIQLRGWESVETIRGQRFDFLVLDEVASMRNFKIQWQEVLRPTLSDNKGDALFISTPKGFNHFYSLFNNAEKDKDYKSFRFTTYDNPFIAHDEIEKAREEMDADSFAQEYLAEFKKVSGLIYKDFDRNIHMVNVPIIDGNYTITRSLDFGFEHKSALLYFAIAPEGNAIYCYDGLYKNRLTTKELADVIRVKDTGRIITNPVADSAQPMMIEELRREGVTFYPVVKGADSVKNGINKVSELLKVRNDTGKPTLMFAKELEYIAWEFENYQWIENRSSDNTVKEVPYKINDDCMDAIRYFAMSYKEREGEFIDPNIFNDDSGDGSW